MNKFDAKKYLFGIWLRNLPSILSNDWEADYLAGFSEKDPHGIEIKEAKFVFEALVALGNG